MNAKIPDVHDAYAVLADRHGDMPPCPACHQPIWDLLNEPIILRTMGRDPTVHAIGLACHNCGYLRLHVGTYLLS
jgi:hypothetical protein